MGSSKSMKRRVVFDTNTVLSALLFKNGRLSWLREHWRTGGCVPLLSRETAAELTRVLAYPKFGISPDDRNELLADVVPYCEVVTVTKRCAVVCRDTKDQPFLDLSYCGKADLLISGDRDLLALASKTRFAIETPEAYRNRIARDG
jgi:putative PIN family toxin of toxin-antitoxin system